MFHNLSILVTLDIDNLNSLGKNFLTHLFEFLFTLKKVFLDKEFLRLLQIIWVFALLYLKRLHMIINISD